eukprot:scaffold32562_cov34-Cyclotella_meneghiniana.AAC.2
MEYSSTKQEILPDITTLFIESDEDESLSGGKSSSFSNNVGEEAKPSVSVKTSAAAAGCSEGQCESTKEEKDGTTNVSVNILCSKTEDDSIMESIAVDNSSQMNQSKRSTLHDGESNIDFVSRIHGTLTQVSMERKSLDGAVVAPHRRDTDVNILSDLIDLPVYKEPCGENEQNTVDSTSLKALTNSDKRNGDVRGPLMNDKVVQTKTTIPNKPNNRGSKVGRHPSSTKADSLKSTTANLVRKTVADSSLQCSLIGNDSCRGSKESTESKASTATKQVLKNATKQKATAVKESPPPANVHESTQALYKVMKIEVNNIQLHRRQLKSNDSIVKQDNQADKIQHDSRYKATMRSEAKPSTFAVPSPKMKVIVPNDVSNLVIEPNTKTRESSETADKMKNQEKAGSTLRNLPNHLNGYSRNSNSVRCNSNSIGVIQLAARNENNHINCKLKAEIDASHNESVVEAQRPLEDNQLFAKALMSTELSQQMVNTHDCDTNAATSAASSYPDKHDALLTEVDDSVCKQVNISLSNPTGTTAQLANDVITIHSEKSMEQCSPELLCNKMNSAKNNTDNDYEHRLSKISDELRGIRDLLEARTKNQPDDLSRNENVRDVPRAVEFYSDLSTGSLYSPRTVNSASVSSNCRVDSQLKPKSRCILEKKSSQSFISCSPNTSFGLDDDSFVLLENLTRRGTKKTLLNPCSLNTSRDVER